jgi:carbonic anhydrase/acetyltransferase-like protein (isoleucine patch superfamily)
MAMQFEDAVPAIHESAFVAWNAEVAGAVSLEKDTSVWFSAVVRPIYAKVEVGDGSNLQDGSVVHVDYGQPCVIGRGVTVGPPRRSPFLRHRGRSPHRYGRIV